MPGTIFCYMVTVPSRLMEGTIQEGSSGTY